MDRRQPFGKNPVGINLLQLPAIGNAQRNLQQFLNNMQGFGIPPAQGQQNTNREQYGRDNRGEEMRFSDNNYHYYYERDQRASNSRGPRTSREPHNSQNLDRDNFRFTEHGSIPGLMEKEVPSDILFPEIETSRSNHASKTASFGSEPERSADKEKGLYGKRDNTPIPWNAQLRPNCFLVPPLDDTNVLPLGDRQPGCCAVFVGGLPWVTDDFIVREIFNICGPIKSVTFKNTRKSSQVKYCQVGFYKKDSVDKAVTFNGHVLVIGDGRDRKNKIGRIRVNYDQEVNKNNQEKTNDDTPKPAQKVEVKELELQFFNRKNAFKLLDLIRNDTSVVESLELISHWFEKGECNPFTVTVFHTVLSTVHSFIKRLIAKRKEHEKQVEKQKKLAINKSNDIKQQCDAVWKVFESATKQKSFDHFTKGQRKTISQWHDVVKNEMKSAKEAEIQNREEVGMDLDDEVPNLGGLIEQPALQIAAEHHHEQDDEQAPPKAKKPRCDTSEADAASTVALKSENEKLRTQVESLKGIAEQHTNLMWSMQSYQHQADLTRQQYSDRLKEKDQEILRLQKALQHVKENITDKELLTELEGTTSTQSSELQIVVELSGYQTTTNEVAMTQEDSKAYDEEERREQMTGDGHEMKDEQVAENRKEVHEETSGEEDKLTEVKAKLVEEGTPEEEGGKTVEEGENTVKRQESAEMEILARQEEKPGEEEGQTVGEEKATEQQQKPGEEDEEEGHGRFVQIDDEQFEVIDDMEEDSDDDLKEGTTQKPLNEDAEHMSEELTSKDDYKEVAAHSANSESVEHMNEGLPNEADHQEVVAQDPLNESADQASEQAAVDWSYYQQAYNAQYQTWPSYGTASYGSMDLGPNVVRLSGEELVLVGIICSYLQLCPAGATSGEVRDYLSRQFKERRKDVVEKLLYSLPVLFTTAESSGNTKFKFCGFDMFQSKSEQ